MCGIFGMVRNIHAPHGEKASAVLIELGRHSVERGRDSAGLAFIPRADLAASTVYGATKFQATNNVVNLDGVVIAKDTTTFDEFWDDEKYLPVLAASQVVIGHTRAATQGNRRKLENSSPLAVGYVVGTHNGDIDTFSVPESYKYRNDLFGGTDTEYLYRAIDAKAGHRKKITDILTAIRGRAAMAWVDRRTNDQLMLARAALSPLAVAYDAEGNFYWASNPNWFRLIDEKFGYTIGFQDISIVGEGSLLTVSYHSGSADVVDVRNFVPTTRYSDSIMSESIVWRNFDAEDAKADQDKAIHLVAPKPVYKSTTTATSSVGSSYSSYAGRNWDDSPWNSSKSKDLFSHSDEQGIYTINDASEAPANGVFDDDAYAFFGDALTDEVQEATIEWADKGMSVLVYQVCKEASKESDYERIAKDYGLSSSVAARLFAHEVVLWQEDDANHTPAVLEKGDDLDRQIALNEAASV